MSELGLHPDHLRKMGAGIRLAHEAGMIGSAEQLPAPVSSHELQKLRDLRREINESYRADARSEALREAVIQATRNLPPICLDADHPVAINTSRSLLLA